MRLVDIEKFDVFDLSGRSEEFANGVQWILEQLDNAPVVHHPDCDNCEDKAKQYSMGFQDGYLTGKETPKGEWVEDLTDYDSHYPKHCQDLYRCSKCGGKGQSKTLFCSNCGSKMKLS